MEARWIGSVLSVLGSKLPAGEGERPREPKLHRIPLEIRAIGAALPPGLRLGHDDAGLFGEVFPTIDMLVRADEDPRVGRYRAIPRNVQFGDVARAIGRAGQEAEDVEVPGG